MKPPKTSKVGRRPSDLIPGPRAVNPPVHRASTILLSDACQLYDNSIITYGREGLEPQRSLCDALARLEGGHSAYVFPSGLAAITGTLSLLVEPGDEIILVDCIYGRTRRFCDTTLRRWGVSVRYVAPDVTPDALSKLFAPRTRVLMLESPGSSTFEVQDVAALAFQARRANVLTVVDNTWAAGELFKPLTHGADISIQSLTKYVGGHSDCFLGAAVVREQALDDLVGQRYSDFGWAVSPEDCYLMYRGLQTLRVRLKMHAAGADIVCDWLRNRAGVFALLAPQLPGDPSHVLWNRDFTGHNGLVTIVLDPRSSDKELAFLNSLKCFGLGFSWGGHESLALLISPQLAARTVMKPLAGPAIRLHVGLEDPNDLIEDLDRAFTAYL